ncbi:MAG: peptidoglycan glycosyltransferase [Lachnospiraceae bacterium]|nr:peptidoglycan glycosyltransferase [Lachnospiraceae bacterium]
MSKKKRGKRRPPLTREERLRKEHRERRKLFRSMKEKLFWFVGIVFIAFVLLGFRIVYISKEKGDEYTKQVLLHQQYDSRTLPFKRGEILDAGENKLAYSEKVYNLILDANEINSSKKEDALSETMKALSTYFQIDTTEVAAFIKDNPHSMYRVIKKRISYDIVEPFLQAKEENKSICGIWFEEEYKRKYPCGTMASALIGFSGTDNNGQCGLEKYYDDTLNGSNGREYGYFTEESTLERTTIPARDGDTLVTSLDINLQNIVEKYMDGFVAAHRGEYREGEDGVKNMGIIMMNPKTGEILAMADYPNFDLNDPYDMTKFLSQGEIDAMDEEARLDYLNGIWRNFCISDTYEPGSVAKSMTIAAGLDSGALAGTESFFCGGKLTVSGHEIKCHKHSGHGMVNLSQALEQSCNVALMQIGEMEGKDTLMKYLYNFNMGLKTNIDLSGEARTDSLVYKPENMVASDLAISTFGQGYNVSMIQMVSAFCSIVNGGKYYQPHLVTEIRDSAGTTLKKIEPRMLKQTISATTSDTMREYLTNVCLKGTGKTAVPAGYVIGGKTGTAERQPRDGINYVMSFMGFAPVDDPQVVIYCVIDRPNVEDQPHSTLAQDVVKDILTEALPYLHIYRTEELTEEQIRELEEKNLLSVSENGVNKQDTETTEDAQEPAEPVNQYDPETGALIDPSTGLPVQTEEDDGTPSSDLGGLIGIENDPAKALDDDSRIGPPNASGLGGSSGGNSGIGAGAAVGAGDLDVDYQQDNSPSDTQQAPSPGGETTVDFGAGVGF